MEPTTALIFAKYVVALTMRADLFCWKRDPARMDYCIECVTECVLDEGKENEQWCLNDYLETMEME